MEFGHPGSLLAPTADDSMSPGDRASLLETLAAAFEDSPFFHGTYSYDEKGRRTEIVRRMGGRPRNA